MSFSADLTMVKYPIPGLHVVPPHLGSDLSQHSRRYVQHGGGGLEHERDAVDETLSFRVDVVQHQTQTFPVQNRAHSCLNKKKKSKKK